MEQAVDLDQVLGALANGAGPSEHNERSSVGQRTDPAGGMSEIMAAGTAPGRMPVFQEHTMSINKGQIKGRVTEAKGMIKEAAGKLVGNERLEAKGKIQKVLGETQAKIGDVKADIKDATRKGR